MDIESAKIIAEGLDSIGGGLFFVGLVFFIRMLFNK